MPDRAHFASPVDVATYGPYRFVDAPDDPRPRLRFRGRITADGSSGFAAEAGRYHIYSGWFCPYAQRALIALELSGLRDVVSVSSVDSRRDACGWAFRESEGVDPVNGFTLLRDAYEVTEPGFDGHVSVPTLWDRVQGCVVSNEYHGIEVDLATQFRSIAPAPVYLYPAPLRHDIDELDEWLAQAVDRNAWSLRMGGEQAEFARRGLQHAFTSLDRRLGSVRFLFGDGVTLADVRLFVTLVRFDAARDLHSSTTPSLDDHPNLWRWARDLYRIPAFRETTVFGSFGGTDEHAVRWDEASKRLEGREQSVR